MQLQNANRKKAKIKLGLQGPSGSGKTYSSLLLGFGLTNDWTKIAVIDTENKSASLYAHLGPYKVVNIKSPFTPEVYIEAIHLCEDNGIEVIIIDSISHEWEGSGGILDTHSRMAGNSFTNWAKLSPRHNSFIEAMLQSRCHVIGCIRTKQDYVLVERNGKQVPEKVGLRSITRDGLDYEFTIVFDIDIKHNANVSKDRTELFAGKPEFKISAATGQIINEWCLRGEINQDDILSRINDCQSIGELLSIYRSEPDIQESLLPQFTKRKMELSTQNTNGHNY
ncbi:MAG: AAA family ATPase [Segetibacter sp.]